MINIFSENTTASTMTNTSLIRLCLIFLVLFSWLFSAITVHGEEQPLPIENNAAMPSESDTTEPVENDAAVPGGSDTTEPVENDAAVPGGSDTTEPVENDAAVPTGSDTTEPVENDAAVPGGSDTIEPVDNDAAVPTGSDTTEPVENDAAVPGGSDTTEPVENDAAVPGGSDTTEPAENDATEPGRLVGLMDSSHAYILDLANGPALWFDSFFGNRRSEDVDQPSTFIRLRVTSHLVEGEGLTFPVRLRANIKIPRADRKLRMILSGEDDDDFTQLKDEETSETEIGVDETEKRSRLGLRYNLYKTLREKLHLGGGLSISDPFKYYVRIRFRRLLHIGRQNIVRFNQNAYWNSIDGRGATTVFDFERIRTETVTSRVSLTGNYSEISRGVNWGVSTSFFKKLSPKSATSLELGVFGITRPETEVLNYIIAWRLRKNILRSWLFFEVTPGVSFPLDELTRERDALGSLTIMFEAQFTAN